MKFWLLTRNDCDYDECESGVVRAETEFNARKLMYNYCKCTLLSDEEELQHYAYEFLNHEKSSCVEVLNLEKEEVILAYYTGG